MLVHSLGVCRDLVDALSYQSDAFRLDSLQTNNILERVEDKVQSST